MGSIEFPKLVQISLHIELLQSAFDKLVQCNFLITSSIV